MEANALDHNKKTETIRIGKEISITRKFHAPKRKRKVRNNFAPWLTPCRDKKVDV